MSRTSPLVWSSTWTLISFFFLVIIRYQYDSIISVYVKECNEYGSQCVFLPLEGVGFFTAGYVANGATVPGALTGDNRVLWSDLNADNACLPGTDMYMRYSSVLNLCSKSALGVTTFALPPAIRQMQMDITVALLASFISVVSSAMYGCFDAPRAAVTAIGMSATSALATLRCVNLLVNWDGTKLYTDLEGFYIPLWASDGRTIMLERFSLRLNNPQFQLLVVSVPAFCVGTLGTLFVVLSRSSQVQSDRHLQGAFAGRRHVT